jgi:hypothetical protein
MVGILVDKDDLINYQLLIRERVAKVKGAGMPRIMRVEIF